MTIKQFALIAAAIKTYFPRDNILPTENAMELWYEELKDIPYSIANSALRMFVSTNKFPPTIADIRENAAKLNPEMQSSELNEMAAWQLVLKAMRNSIYHSEEEFAKLPPLIQKAVVSPGQLREWAMAEDVDGTWMNVTQSNFMRTYRAEVSRQNEQRKLSPDLLKLVIRNAEQDKIQDKNSVVYGEKYSEKNSPVPMPEKAKRKLEELLMA